jgi:hypothetical protein
MRKTLSILIAALGTLAALPGHAAGVVQVEFLPFDRYTDAGRDPVDASRKQDVLTRHLQALGKQWLPDGQTLKVEMLDVDLAGSQRPGQGEITGRRRSIGGADTPHFQVRYALTQGSTVLASGEEHLDDLNYLRHGADIVGDDPLKTEKRVLDAWFKQRFVEKKPAPAK